MALFLDRVDSVPAINMDFDVQFLQWLWVLVDTLNEDISDIDNVVMSIGIVSATTQAIQLNTRYMPTNVALTTFQLPDKMPVGARATIAGQGVGGWILLTGAGQTIKIGDVGASASTSIASASRYDSIEIICVEKDLTWITLSTQTTGFVIV